MTVDRSQFEPALTPDEISLRDCFVNEYMRDFDAYAACLRLGFMSSFAVHQAQILPNCGYVQRKIAQLKSQPDPEGVNREQSDKALLENVLREAMQKGPYASRVAAGRAFAELKGWNKPDGNEGAEQALIDALKEFAGRAPA
jgi:hypothetical protein